jgi:hypothetical protein
MEKTLDRSLINIGMPSIIGKQDLHAEFSQTQWSLAKVILARHIGHRSSLFAPADILISPPGLFAVSNSLAVLLIHTIAFSPKAVI